MLFVGGSLVAIAASVLGAVLGPLLGVFFLAALVPFCNWKGALVGGIISAFVNLWMLFGLVATRTQVTRLPAPTHGCLLPEGTNSTDGMLFIPTSISLSSSMITDSIAIEEDKSFLHWMYSISFILYSLIGVILSMTFGVIFSLLTGYTKIENLNPDLVAGYVYCGSEVNKTKYQSVEIKENKIFVNAEMGPTHWSKKQLISSM